MIKTSMAWAQLIPNFVFLRWGQEALYITEVNPSIEADPYARARIEDALDYMHGYDIDDFWPCIGMTFLIGVVLRILSVLGLVYLNQDKQAQV